ncbi:MAG: hypothetical protein K6G51_05685 [Sphaerochaetaceae bacterium]|nr:hypothetical protein [Sphaerochaetaceae bacterium]
MINSETYSYFLSLLDEAERVVTKDKLAEKLRVCRYTVTPIKEEVKPAPMRAVQKGALSPLALVRDCYINCHACPLWQNRPDNDHPGVGTAHPLILFVVDKRLPDGSFLSKPDMAYLESWIKALCLEKNKEVHLSSIIKCPGGQFEISENCVKIFESEVDALKPRAIVFLGEASSMIATGNPNINETRGQLFRYRKIPSVVTFSPAMVLSDQSLKRPVWDDLRLAGDAADIRERRQAARR